MQSFAAEATASPRDKFDLVMLGAQYGYAALLERAPEFDEAAALEHYYNSPELDSAHEERLAGARWQHEQMSAQIAALREALEAKEAGK
jgi:hypothetical protein